MAATITIVEPPAKPTINSITVNSGAGSFKADTYSFMLVCEYDGTWWNTVGGYSRLDPTAPLSPASDIESGVIISAGDSITVDFDIGDADGWYMLYYREGEPDNGWVLMDSGPRDDASPYEYLKPFHDWYNYFWSILFYYPDRPMGLPVNKGYVGIHITGDGDVTIEDINDALRASGAVEGDQWLDGKADQLIVNGGLCFDLNYGAGEMDITGQLLYTSGVQKFYGITLKCVANPGVNTTRLMPFCSQLLPYPNYYETLNLDCCFFGSPYFGINQRIPNRPYVNIASGEVTNSYFDVSIQGFGLTGIGNGCILNYSGPYLEGNVDGVTFFIAMCRIMRDDGLLTDCRVVSDTSAYAFLAYCNAKSSDVELRDSRLEFATDWSYQATYYFTKGEAVNPEFFFETYIGCYAYANSGGYRPKLKFTSSLILTIVDDNGDPLEGVTVSAVGDGDGVDHINDSTDVNGEISGSVPYYQVNFLDHPTSYTKNMTEGTEIEFIRNTKYTLTISKSGYQEQEYEVELDEATGNKQEGTIQLLADPVPLKIDSVDITNVSEDGGSDGEIAVTASGGDGSYEYSINGTDYKAGNTFTGLSEDIYTVYVRDGAGEVTSLSNIEVIDPVRTYVYYQQNISGSVSAATITGLVEREAVSGSVDQTAVSGSVETEAISGQVSVTEIEGTI